MSEKLVSVIIPTYSRPLYLDRAIKSVLSQTYKNIEIIVVDDNNPNSQYRKDTEKIMEGYKKNKRIVYLKHEKNKNGSAARNTGWRHSNGDYITFVDDDDELESDKILEQVRCLESLDNTWGMCYTKYEVLKENGLNQISSEKRSGYLFVESLMRTLYLGSGSNLFLRRNVVEEIRGYDESFTRNQDIEFLVRACEKYKIAYIDKKLLIIHQEGNRKKRNFEELEQINKFYLNAFSEKIDSLSKKDKKRVISVITLERVRMAIINKKIWYALNLLFTNKISICNIIKYMSYLFNRVITGKSYGFNIK